MNTMEFVNNIPAEKIAAIFKDFFEQHMLVYGLLKGVQFVSLNNVTMDEASIMYSVQLLDNENKERLVNKLQNLSGSIAIYAKEFTPQIFLNGDLLCITIKK